MLATPLHFDAIVSGFGGFVFTKNCTVFLRFALHFNSECTLRKTIVEILQNSLIKVLKSYLLDL